MEPEAVALREGRGLGCSVPAALKAATMYLHPTKKPRTFQEPGRSTHLSVPKIARPCARGMSCVLSWPHPRVLFHCLLTPLTPPGLSP